MALKFFSLHNHTNGSVYDALGSPKDYAEWMLQNAGEDSGGLAITNHGNLNDCSYQAAAQQHYDKTGAPVKMVYGVEFYHTPDLAQWRVLKQESDEKKKEDKKKAKEEEQELLIENEEESKKNKWLDPLNKRNHLVVCAANQEGLTNLFQLVARSYREGFYKKPRIDDKMLKDHNKGLIVSTACIAGKAMAASFYARENNLDIMDAYENELGPLMEIFGKDRFFLELQFNKLPQQQIANLDMIEFSKKSGFKLIAAADAHYCQPDMWKDRDLYKLLGWQMRKQDVSEQIEELQQTRLQDLDCQLYLKNGDQMFEAYKEEFVKHFDDEQLIKEAIERSYDIAHNYIEQVYPDNSIKLPKTFQVTEEIKTPFDQLKKLVVQGLKDKGLSTKKKYVDRTVYELQVIKNLDVAQYFLTDLEIVNEMKKYGLTGAGRGSAAGSIVNYLVGITMIDPVKYGLIFERFMSPSRKELPDIDNDVEAKDKALEILSERFGQGNVLAITNYNRLQLKSLIKDISKLYGVPFQEVNEVMKVAEDEARSEILDEIGGDQKLYDFNFEGAKKYSPTFARFVKKYPEVGEHIENLYQAQKSIGAHAGGVCVLEGIEKYVPILKIRGVEQAAAPEGLTAQHLQAYFGVPKFDVLGLTTLKIISSCIKNVLRSWGVESPNVDDIWAFYDEFLHPDVINDADPLIFEKVYHKGQFPSIFQFTEKGVQKFVQQAKPESVLDISAVTALWRPGPLLSNANITYLGASDAENVKKFKQEHPIIQKILGNTRGNLLYQEQFQQMAHELAGFSLEEANTLRKLLVKPATSLGEELKTKRIEAGERFIAGCIEKGLTEERAKRLWEKEILGFISYGFNFSHSLSYAFNSYHCAYLYTYHEQEWIKSCLENDPDQQKTINVVRQLGYDVQKPDINRSEISEWKVDGKECIPSLTSLKGLGVKGAEELVKNRPEGGFTNIEQFFFDGEEFRYSKFNKKCLTALIRMEAFNSMGIVGPEKLFKNYAHMERALFGTTTKLKRRKNGESLGKYITYQNFDLIKKRKNTIEELALEADSEDWPTAQKIDFQREIVGFYDKGLIIGEYLPIFREFEIDAIDETEDEDSKKNIWAVVEEVKQKTSSSGKPYVQVWVTGMTEKRYMFRVWNTEKRNDPHWQEGNVNCFSLDYDDEWGYNVPFRSKIMRIEK